MSIEDRVESLEKRVQKLEDILAGKTGTAKKPDKSGDLESLIVNNADHVGTQDLVVLALKLKPKQTKSQIEGMLKELGKAVGNWFNGSNFNRLIRKGIIKEDGLNEKNVQLYSLTKKGNDVTAPKIIEKMRSGKAK